MRAPLSELLFYKNVVTYMVITEWGYKKTILEE
jgi:hypothetical protein